MPFTSPLISATQVHELAARYLEDDAKQEVKDADVIEAGANLLANKDVRDNLQLIFRWKLQAFVKRFSRYRIWPNGISDNQIMEGILAAQQVDATDHASVRNTLLKLDKIPQRRNSRRFGLPDRDVS